MSPVSWIEQDPDPTSVIETDEPLIVCSGCPHALAVHVEVDGWWPCRYDDCPCPNWLDATGCPYCHGKRWATDENGYEHNCGMCT